MNKIETFEQFLATESIQVPIVSFVINLLLAALLSYILSKVYVKYGSSLSNRKDFGRNFVLITTTTMLIISIVKSSLALSLGLVGALSIVRFRAAIKEPEELSYLFLSIAVGLGFGADQRVITTVAFFIIVALMILKNIKASHGKPPNIFLTLNSSKAKRISLDDIVAVLKEHCTSIDIKRFDEVKDILEASFLVECKDYEELNDLKVALKDMDDSIKISFVDNKGLF